MIFPRNRRHSLWVFHEGGKHVGWYVNLEAPHVYGDRTISTRDGILDIWVSADTGEPVWKDEDEFAMAVTGGTPQQGRGRSTTRRRRTRDRRTSVADRLGELATAQWLGETAASG